mmetsp:Transcript_9974/g.28961  ORF Transcript_9974/g.28961 Transcript_9974/m.28961 type:complete len:249 (+) Transcript_9974:139-885(+)
MHVLARHPVIHGLLDVQGRIALMDGKGLRNTAAVRSGPGSKTRHRWELRPLLGRLVLQLRLRERLSRRATAFVVAVARPLSARAWGPGNTEDFVVGTCARVAQPVLPRLQALAGVRPWHLCGSCARVAHVSLARPTTRRRAAIAHWRACETCIKRDVVIDEPRRRGHLSDAAAHLSRHACAAWSSQAVCDRSVKVRVVARHRHLRSVLMLLLMLLLRPHVVHWRLHLRALVEAPLLAGKLLLQLWWRC